MKIKVKDASGLVLDYLVAKCEGAITTGTRRLPNDDFELFNQFVEYSSDWAFGGPIIEREYISFRMYYNPNSGASGTYYAKRCAESGTMINWKGWGDEVQKGPTPLVAAMRCYVVTSLGMDVEVPDKLVNKADSYYDQ